MGIDADLPVKALRAVVLAAGKGTRLQTEDDDAPKVMRQARGKPLLRYVLDALSFMKEEDITIVVGYKKDEIIDRFQGYSFAVQAEQLGTGHAVMAASQALSSFEGSVLVCYGDMPVVRRDTYEALVEEHFARGNDCTILTGEAAAVRGQPDAVQGQPEDVRGQPAADRGQPEADLPYGRVIRDSNGDFLCVVEDRDCTPEQRAIRELNSGVYVFRAQPLMEALKMLKNDNTQNEYYLTDVPAILREGGAAVGLLKRDLGDEMIGVNTLAQLAQVERILGKEE